MPLETNGRDLLIIIGIVSSLVFAAILYVFLVPERFWPHLTHAWFSFVCFSVLLAVILGKMYWPARRVRRVWLLLVVFMAVHIAAYIALLHRVRDWPAFSYILTGPVEVMLFAWIAWLWLKVSPSVGRRF